MNRRSFLLGIGTATLAASMPAVAIAKPIPTFDAPVIKELWSHIGEWRYGHQFDAVTNADAKAHVMKWLADRGVDFPIRFAGKHPGIPDELREKYGDPDWELTLEGFIEVDAEIKKWSAAGGGTSLEIACTSPQWNPLKEGCQLSYHVHTEWDLPA
jgi:hypothetical protein